MTRLIGIAGIKGSGKDTLAEVLIYRHKFTKVSFSDPLKSILSEVMCLPPIQLEDAKLKDALFPQPIEIMGYHINRILDELELKGTPINEGAVKGSLALAGFKATNPRELMQFVAEMVRCQVGQDTWVNLWLKEQAKHERVIATDARYPNERQAVRSLNGKNVLVKRPDLLNNDSHISENNLGDENEYNCIVTNDVCKMQLQSGFSLWYTTIRG